ncbi:ABC transporter ATP-binding protein [Streptomyces sp. NPDC014779]|uniref:ABC transporter ATP-binding protein n=1 Tax=Streptomyces sp. NPDC014779 TaxID=3364911 RepID=UPI0037012589
MSGMTGVTDDEPGDEPGDETAGDPGRRLIDVREVSRTYDGDRAVLSDVTLRVGAGEALAVIGPSGSGKSTLLNLLAGLDRPTTGTVTVGGLRVDAMSETASARYRRSHVGMVHQFFHLLDDLTVRDNVLLPAQLAGLPRDEAAARADALLRHLGVARRAAAHPGSLSGGERQRVAVARALMNRPPLLLADEPTGALDSASGAEVRELLRELNADGQTIVLVTHDLALAESCATRTVELMDGRITRDERKDRDERTDRNGVSDRGGVTNRDGVSDRDGVSARDGVSDGTVTR